ncbi:MAG: beta-Ala-His dipeptidase [Promethearchaeota archaeon]
MTSLINLGQPHEFWKYFYQISKIPRCSKQEEKIRNFIKTEAEKFGFEYKIDKVGNIVVKIQANDQKLKCILQSHMDMVCEKNEATIHDFSKDPLKLKIIDIEDEKWITAEGTTLGADNGVGVCYSLTIMKKIYQNKLKFNSLGLDLLFTVREEYDMAGAQNVNLDLVNGNYLINLDSARQALTIGCAGAIGFHTKINGKSTSINQDQLNLIPINISITGLVGGHSGGCNKGQAHAILILSQILWNLNNKFQIYINKIHGGDAANAIPREANSILFVKQNHFEEVKIYIREIFREIKILFDGIEKDMKISIKKLDGFSNNKVFSKRVQDKLLNLLYIFPNGPIAFHPKIKDLMYTSTNLGKIRTKDDYIKLRWLHRSLSEYYNNDIYEQILRLLELSGLEKENTFRNSYPPWEPDFDSKLLKIAQDSYRELFEENIDFKIIHGGLEATLLINKIPEIEAIAIGPHLEKLHSPDECLQVKSVEKTWNFLNYLLKRIDKC